MISYGKSYKSYNERAFVSEVRSIKAFANLTVFLLLSSLVRSRAFKSPTSYKHLYYIRLVRNSCFFTCRLYLRSYRVSYNDRGFCKKLLEVKEVEG